MPARRARRTSAVFECASFINCSRWHPFSLIVLATRIVASQAQLIILGFDDLRLVPLITKHYTSNAYLFCITSIGEQSHVWMGAVATGADVGCFRTSVRHRYGSLA